jgi:predicted dehydrogenase
MATDATLDVGIVGLGGMGTNHANSAVDLGHDVVAGADVVPESRESFAAEFDAATYEGHEEMYDDAAPDAVVVTTPNAFHEPAVVSALERGIDVLCEKPLADSLAAAERIVEADHDADAFCMVGFHSRFSVAADLATAYRERGDFGEVTHVEGNFVRRRGIPGVGSWFTDRDLSGGGAVVDIGVHLVDFALYLAGYPDVTEVSAVARSEFGTRDDYADPDGWGGNWDDADDTFDVDDSASAFLRCADDTTLSLEVAWATNREPTNEIHLRGTEGGARCELAGDSLTVLDAEQAGTDHYVDSELRGDRGRSGHEAEVAAFLDGVAAGERPEMNTVDEALVVQRVLDAIYRSSDEGAAVEL